MKPHDPIDQIAQRVQRYTLTLSLLFLALMIAIVLLNVFCRYLLHTSLTWSSELARYCLVWSSLLAAVVLTFRGEHLTVDLITQFSNPKVLRWLRDGVTFLSMTFFAIMFLSGVWLVFATRGQFASSIGFLPMSVVYVIIPLSALLMFFGTFAHWLRSTNGASAS